VLVLIFVSNKEAKKKPVVSSVLVSKKGQIPVARSQYNSNSEDLLIVATVLCLIGKQNTIYSERTVLMF